MHPHPRIESFTQSFLQALDAEEQLLQQAVAICSELFSALRKGDLAPIKLAQPRQQALAAQLVAAGDRRETAVSHLARALGLAPQGITLSQLAGCLEPLDSSRVLEARDRLTAITTELAIFQRRNANLIHHLRSYFRNVLFTITKAPDVPVRYGSSGSRLNPAFGTAFHARG